MTAGLLSSSPALSHSPPDLPWITETFALWAATGEHERGFACFSVSFVDGILRNIGSQNGSGRHITNFHAVKSELVWSIWFLQTLVGSWAKSMTSRCRLVNMVRKRKSTRASHCLKIARVSSSLPTCRNHPVAAAPCGGIKCCEDTCMCLIPAQTSLLPAHQGGERIYLNGDYCFQ